MSVKFDYTMAKNFINEEELMKLQGRVSDAHNAIGNKSGAGSEFLGWVRLPYNYDKDEFLRIKAAAEKIREQSDILLVIGVGGSYLGAKAAIDFISSPLANYTADTKIFFVGNSLSSSYMAELYDIVKDKDFSINVISKSGTTTEPALAFRVFRELIEKKYGKDGSRDRIYVTTDKKRGALKALSDKEGYETFVIPDDVGGRFSVLTAVGLLPIAVSGADIDEIMQGARDACDNYETDDIKTNECYQYAASRFALMQSGKIIEILANYEPSLNYMTEWWKQLFGESEGKEHKGLFPAGASFSTDLHSFGQYIQDGKRCLFETIINVKTPKADLVINSDSENIDGLNFLTGKSVGFINYKAMQGTTLAHSDGGTPNLTISIDKLDSYHFGYLVYFFEKACAVSAYMLGVNPFNQPGVEEYKNNMFALLGKPGFEKRKEQLEARLDK